MIKKIFVTTFNYFLFEKYANKLIDSFIKTEQNLQLYCYVEDDVELYPKNKNIVYLNLYTNQPSCLQFVERNKKKSEINSKISYLLDPVRFSYKVFAQSDARKYSQHFFYIDVTLNFLKKFQMIGLMNVCLKILYYQYMIGLVIILKRFVAFNNLLLNKKTKAVRYFFYSIY